MFHGFLRQISSAHSPVRSSSAAPMGTIQWLKKVAFTLMRSRPRNSDRVGNMVANSTTTMANTNNQLPAT